MTDQNIQHHGGCCSSGGGCCRNNGEIALNQQERDFLLMLLERHFLPMVQFVVKSSHTHEFEMVALSPVYLEDVAETMPQVRQRGEMLRKLEEHGLITLDYDIPMEPQAYEMYHKSQIFAYLQETVELGKQGGGHLGDLATIEEGSIGITKLCLEKYG